MKKKQKEKKVEKPKETPKYINLKPEVYERLCKAKGFVQMNVGREVSFNDAVDAILRVFEVYKEAVLEKQVGYGEVEEWASMVAGEMENEPKEPKGE